MFEKLKNLCRKRSERVVERKAAKPLPPFEEREKVHPLSLVVTIVDRHRADFFLNAYREIGASLSMVLYARSMPPEEIVQLLGAESTKKDIILTVAREEYVKPMLTRAKARFRISKASKGIAFACPIDAVSGIAVYKFLSDQNKNVRINENGKQK